MNKDDIKRLEEYSLKNDKSKEADNLSLILTEMTHDLNNIIQISYDINDECGNEILSTIFAAMILTSSKDIDEAKCRLNILTTLVDKKINETDSFLTKG